MRYLNIPRQGTIYMNASNLVLLICSIGLLSISSLLYFSDSLVRFNFCLDPISIIFVFSMRISILLISHHWLTEVAFICNLEEIFWIFLLVWWSVTPLANRNMFSNAGFRKMSFIKKMKNKGPRTEPCGTPAFFLKDQTQFRLCRLFDNG